MDTPVIIFISILLFILGAVMGSFLECLGDRTSKGVSIISKSRSYCPACGHTLGPLDLIPIFSWLFLRGKCHYCKAPIPKRHVIFEALTAIAYVLIFLRFGFSTETLLYLVLISILIPASVSDLNTMEVSNAYFIVAAACYFALFWIGNNDIVYSLKQAAFGGIAVPAGLLIVSLILGKVLNKDALGGADIKLLFAIGLYLGLGKSLLNVFIMSIVGLVGSLIMKKAKKEEFPLVPYITIATFITIMIGDVLIKWYTGLF